MDTVTKEAKLLAAMLETGRKVLLANVSLLTSEGDMNFNDVVFVHITGNNYKSHKDLTLPPCEREYSIKEMKVALVNGYYCTNPVNLAARADDSISIRLDMSFS